MNKNIIGYGIVATNKSDIRLSLNSAVYTSKEEALKNTELYAERVAIEMNSSVIEDIFSSQEFGDTYDVVVLKWDNPNFKNEETTCDYEIICGYKIVQLVEDC